MDLGGRCPFRWGRGSWLSGFPLPTVPSWPWSQLQLLSAGNFWAVAFLGWQGMHEILGSCGHFWCQQIHCSQWRPFPQLPHHPVIKPARPQARGQWVAGSEQASGLPQSRSFTTPRAEGQTSSQVAMPSVPSSGRGPRLPENLLLIPGLPYRLMEDQGLTGICQACDVGAAASPGTLVSRLQLCKALWFLSALSQGRLVGEHRHGR